MNLQHRPVRREERGMSIFHHFNWCICSFLTLAWRQASSRLQAEKFLTSCSRAMLICSIIWLESGCCGLLFWRVLFFKRYMRLPRIQCRWFRCIVWSCFYVKLMQITYYDTCVIIDYLTWFDGLYRTLWYVDDNHYHFMGPFLCEKRYQKKHRRE